MSTSRHIRALDAVSLDDAALVAAETTLTAKKAAARANQSPGPRHSMRGPVSAKSERDSGFTILGVRIRVHVSWVIMAVFIAWLLASGEFPELHAGLPRGAYWTAAIIVVAGLGVSILLHELAHTIIGQAYGIRVGRITLFVFGGVAELRGEPKQATAELAMAAAGPAFSIVFSLALAGASALLAQAGARQEVVIAVGYLATLNLVLAAFNLAPAFPLDGGRILRALVWLVTDDLAKATRFATRIGEVLALALIAPGVVLLFTEGAGYGLWWMLVGLFVFSAARGAMRDFEARRLFEGHAIAELMIPNVERVPAHFSLERFVDERLLGSRHGLYPVERDGVWIGVITPEDVLRIPRAEWARLTVGETCRPASEATTAGLLEDAGRVLERMQDAQVERIPVVHGDQVVGIVTVQDLLRSVELWRRFGRTPA